MIHRLPHAIKQYLVVTANYWCFTLTDGALRMLIVLHFHTLGYNALTIASLFIFYELFGMFTNLFGGYIGARVGLNRTMNVGLAMQVIALMMLTLPSDYLTVGYVMAAGALSGMAKDLNKMSAKSSIKSLVASGDQIGLYRWIAWLTGSKNALKGVGFFLGGLLLSLIGFTASLQLMALILTIMLLFSLFTLDGQMGKAKNKPKFRTLFSQSSAINRLAGARVFLFGARDVWFVVALPLYLSDVLTWEHSVVSAFLAAWVIGYGAVQALAPKLTQQYAPVHALRIWGFRLTAVTGLIALFIGLEFAIVWSLFIGLALFGICFAVNSSLHSYLVVDYADSDGVSKEVGFYYMANAFGRLLGTLLSGLIYLEFGLLGALVVSMVMLALANLISLKLPNPTP